jgi:Skp family chaperone for outer membrane proteins
MSKGLIAFIAVAFIAVVAAIVIYMKQSAGKARKISDEMMEEFKTIDKDLQKSTVELDSLNKMYYDSLRNADK